MPSTIEVNESGVIPVLEISTPRSTIIEIITAGPKGDDGAAGDAQEGDSAYQVAVNNGFIGTEAAWLTSLIGADGADGTVGVDGTDGTDGVAGITIVNHGAVGGTARPAGAIVAYWIGAATPTNAIDSDLWKYS